MRKTVTKMLCLFTYQFGNRLIILAVLAAPKLRRVTNCFIMSLGVANFLLGVTVLPPTILVHVTRVLGSLACRQLLPNSC